MKYIHNKNNDLLLQCLIFARPITVIKRGRSYYDLFHTLCKCILCNVFGVGKL